MKTIDPKELRIGNWIKNHLFENQISPDWFANLIMNVNDDKPCAGFYPIPLTEQWLKEFGFGKNESTYGYIYARLENHFMIEYDTKQDYWYFQWDDDGPEPGGVRRTIILYVHQLQNLYFALTSEELERKT